MGIFDKIVNYFGKTLKNANDKQFTANMDELANSSPEGKKAAEHYYDSVELIDRAAANAGDDLIVASKEIKGKPKRYWVKTGLATLVSWTARFWVVNFLVVIPLVAGLGLYEHFLIYGRQLLMWVIMLVSPTPGSSGFAELVFSIFLGEFIPTGLSSSMALIWRLISYYPYLIFGAIILPIWLKRVFSNA